jgi:anthranilate synthase component 2
MLLLIDNYDSFTYNLVHFLGELGAEVTVRRNDALTADEALKMNVKGIVLSCLGHQSIGQVFGGKVVRAPLPMHGKVSQISHKGVGLFEGLPNPVTATRYHSLVVERESLPDCLEITAECDQGLIMGLQHRELPIHGVQFHPESIATEHGHALLANFLTIAGYEAVPA